MKNAIWIAGASGKLGKELTDHLKKDPANKIIGTDMDVDVTDRDSVNRAADVYQPTVVINCASLSNADYCEKNIVEAYKVNTLGARNLASASRKHNATIIHLSTDDVFYEKSAERLNEFDTPSPVSIYGKSKLAGETFVRELNPKHLIIRSSWVYGAVSKEPDYFRYVLDKAEKNEHFSASANRISTPTSVHQLANVISALMEHNEYGIFHASCEGFCSRYRFAKEILTLTGNDPSLVSENDNSSEIVSTVLENLMLKMTGIYEMPDWYEELSEFIRIYKEKY